MLLPTDYAGQAGTAHGTVIFAIPFAKIRGQPFAFEVHDDVIV
jgi:hypothetical protein